MKRATGKNLPKDWEEKLWPRFIECVAKSKDDKESARFVRVLLGEIGRDHVVRRFTAVLMLRDGQTYREIRDALGLSYNTIRALLVATQKGEYVVWEKTERVFKMKETAGISGAIPRRNDLFDSALMDFLLMEVNPKARWRFLHR
jgi:uncharacterized protein YerC